MQDLGKTLSRVNIGKSYVDKRLADYGPQIIEYLTEWLNPDAPGGDRAEEVMDSGTVFVIDGPDAHEAGLTLLKAFVIRRQPVFLIRNPNLAKFWREQDETLDGELARDARVLGLAPFYDPNLMPGPMNKDDIAETEDFLLREMEDSRCMVLVTHGDYRKGWWGSTLTSVLAEKATHLTAVKGRK